MLKMEGWLSADDRRNVLLKRMLERVDACEVKLSHITVIQGKQLEETINQQQEVESVIESLKTLNEHVVTISQQMLEITGLLVRIIGYKPIANTTTTSIDPNKKKSSI